MKKHSYIFSLGNHQKVEIDPDRRYEILKNQTEKNLIVNLHHQRRIKRTEKVQLEKVRSEKAHREGKSLFKFLRLLRNCYVIRLNFFENVLNKWSISNINEEKILDM